jgi:phosphate-selective porin OprO and OprP
MATNYECARIAARPAASWCSAIAAVAVALGYAAGVLAEAPTAESGESTSPIMQYFVHEVAYDEPVVDLAPPSNRVPATDDSPDTTPTESTAEESTLADRVEALERYIREMEQRPAPEEELPPAKETKSDEPKLECTPQDVIVKPTFTPTGRVYFDGVVYDDDDATTEFFNTDRDNEFGFRTFRFGGKGNIWENLIYTMEFEIRGGPNDITYKDIYMEQQNLPHVGHLRAGHFKEPMGLEEFGSDLYNTFMEKTPATQAFTPSRNFGVMIWDNFDPCWDTTWFAGIFRADSPDNPSNTGLWRSDNNDWSFSSRLAWLPFYDEPSKGRYLTHLGGSYSFRHIGGLTSGAAYNQNVAYSTLNGLAEFSKRSWVGSQGPIGFGSEADSNQWNQINGEFLVIWGAASVQSEYFQVLMNSGETYQGGYAFLSYFVTGESRGYRKENKTIDRTIPFEPFFWIDACKGAACGMGAWELAMGYSWVDLDDGNDIVATTPATAASRRRGFNHDVIFGVNWYHNPWSRMQFNYEHEMVDFVDDGVPDSDANIFGVRWQIDW